MAEWDNGLPPEGADITNNDISAVFINKKAVDDTVFANVSAVFVNKEDVSDNLELPEVRAVVIDKADKLDSVTQPEVAAILLTTEPGGQNRVMFL